MADTVATFVDLLKEYYTSYRVFNMVLRNNKLLAIMPKNTDVSGETYDVPIIYGDTPGASSTFARALANKGNMLSDKFQVAIRDDYALASISRKLIKATRGDRGAFLKASMPIMNAAINACRRSLAIAAHLDGSGARAQIHAINDTGSNGIITLGNSTDGAVRHHAVRFQKGDRLNFATTKTGSAIISGSGQDYLEVTSVDRSAGTLTVSGKTTAVFSGGSALAQDDYIYRDGDYDAVIHGLDAYVPATTPSDTLMGVDRSADPDWLGGVRFSATGSNVLDGLIDAQSEVSTVGDGEPDHALIHPSVWRALLKEVGAKVEFDSYSVNETLSFKGLTIQGDGGELRVMPDRYREYASGKLIQLDTWELVSYGGFPEVFDEDIKGNSLRESSADNLELRVGGYGNTACHAPGYNGHVTFDVQS